tara:strand:+ start:660 stop:1478 length:819 start_codon:yes stop_codon:yes gene_type:complete
MAKSQGYKITTRDEAMQMIVSQAEDDVIVSSTGMDRLDKCMGGGLYASKLYGFQARKKVGKTIIMGTMSYNLNEASIPHLWIACEMSAVEIEQRHIARALNVNPIAFLKHRDGGLKDDVKRYRQTAKNNITYADAYYLTISRLCELVKKAVDDHQIEGFFLDYYQLVRGDRENRADHLEEVGQTLAGLVREHNIWCVTAAQLNQDGNTRGGEGLKLTADMVFTLHRDKGIKEGWLEMEESRYTPYRNVGSRRDPGITLETKGLYFTEDIWES